MIAALLSFLARWRVRRTPPAPSVDTAEAIDEARRARQAMDDQATARRRDVAQVRLAQMRIRRDIRAGLPNSGLDYSTLNRQTFGRPPREERQ